MGISWLRLLYFCLFHIMQMTDKALPMLGFEPRISGVGSDRSANFATTTTTAQSKLAIISLETFFPGGAVDARHQRRLPHPAALRADLPDHRVSGKRHLPPDGRGARSVALLLSLFKPEILNYTKDIRGTVGAGSAVLLVIYAVRRCC